jgi:hypothetical protein
MAFHEARFKRESRDSRSGELNINSRELRDMRSGGLKLKFVKAAVYPKSSYSSVSHEKDSALG